MRIWRLLADSDNTVSGAGAGVRTGIQACRDPVPGYDEAPASTAPQNSTAEVSHAIVLAHGRNFGRAEEPPARTP